MWNVNPNPRLLVQFPAGQQFPLVPMGDKLLLRKRALIECVNDQRKNISPIEHTRHRSVVNGWVNLIAAVVAYTFQPKKPALDWDTVDLQPQQQQLWAAAIL